MSLVTRGLGIPGGILVTSGLGLPQPAEVVRLVGDAYIEHLVGDVSGVASIEVVARRAQAAGGAGGVARSGHPLQLVADVRRERAMDVLGLRLVGDGSVDQACGEISGDARIKRLVLVASSASVESAPVDMVRGEAEFVDVELEMAAIALALAA